MYGTLSNPKPDNLSSKIENRFFPYSSVLEGRVERVGELDLRRVRTARIAVGSDHLDRRILLDSGLKKF